MQEYKFSGINKQGAIVKGSIVADDLLHAKALVKAQGLQPLSVTKKNDSSFNLTLKKKKFGIKDKILFYRGINEYYSAGVKLIDSLRYVKKMIYPGLGHIVESQIEKMKEGETFSDSLDFRSFNEVERNLIKTGEKTGKLEEIFLELANREEQKMALKKKIIGALIYPVFTLIMLSVAIVIMMKKVFPQIKESVLSLKPLEQLPPSTQSAFKIMDMVNEYYMFVILGIVGIVVVIFFLQRIKSVKLKIQRIMLHVPLVKTFITVGEIINFTTIMSLSLGAGISILQALTLAINSSKNIVFKEKLFLVYNMVSEGRGMGESLRAIKFDDYAVNLTTMGETTGRLPEALDKVAKYYTKEIDDLSKKLTDMLPLIILVLVGGMVGYMMVNMLMPIFDMPQSIR